VIVVKQSAEARGDRIEAKVSGVRYLV